MSASEETVREGALVGKDTRDPFVGGVHPARLPHLLYGDHVYLELAAQGLRPDAVEAGLRHSTTAGRELFLRLTWPPDHADLGDTVQADGMSLVWTHHGGWSAHTLAGRRPLMADALAAPAVLADAAWHLTQDGLDCEWEPSDRLARWEHARSLDIALAAMEDREVLQ